MAAAVAADQAVAVDLRKKLRFVINLGVVA